jgi:thymidine kinase
MGKIIFKHGTMSSGKTTLLLQTHFNLNAAFPSQVMLINKHDRCGDNICTSRTGVSELATTICDEDIICDVVEEYEKHKKSKIKFILADETQFFTVKQIESLVWLADTEDIEVHAFGLLTSYKGELFPSSKRLLELADKSHQIKNHVRCWCGAPATHNALYVNGKRTFSGEDTIVDNEKLIEYIVVCRKHFFENGRPLQ